VTVHSATGRRKHLALCFRLADASVLLTTSTATVARAAQDTLYAYRTTGGQQPAWHLDITVTEPCHRLLHAPPDVGDVRDVGPGLTARHLTEGRREVFWIDRHRTLVLHDPARRATAVHCATDTAAAYFAARLVRQLMTAQLLAAGAVYAHTAALEHDGRGILIAGHPGAGKTTTLLAVLRRLGGAFVTSDRLLLIADRRDGLRGYAWPAHIRVGIGTLLAYPDLAGLVPTDQRADQAAPHAKAAIEPPEIPRLLHPATVAPRCRPHLMIWPQLTRAPGRPRYQRLTPTAVHAALTSTELFMRRDTGSASSHINHWLAPTPSRATMAANRQTVIDALAQTVPCYYLAAHPDPITLADIVTAIIRDARAGAR
jgi:hypothetical protein